MTIEDKKARKGSNNFWKLILLILALVFSLVAFYFNGELGQLSFSKKINHEKWSSFFTGLATVAGIISIYLLIKQLSHTQDQLRSMEEHRLHAVRPNIYPENITMEAFKDQWIKKGIIPATDDPDYENKMKQYDEDCVVASRKNDYKVISLQNFGMGLATEIKLTWTYSKFESGNQETDANEMEEVNFIPAQGGCKVKIPIGYFRDYYKKWKAYYKPGNNADFEFPLRLQIDYMDIEGTPYRKLFKVVIDSKDFIANIQDIRFETLNENAR